MEQKRQDMQLCFYILTSVDRDVLCVVYSVCARSWVQGEVVEGLGFAKLGPCACAGGGEKQGRLGWLVIQTNTQTASCSVILPR
jgi:hypothetical protein